MAWVWGVVWGAVGWGGVPKALLPNGNGRDGLAQRKMYAGRAVCLHARVWCVVHLWERAVTLSSAGRLLSRAALDHDP